jgi:chromosome partitioning protein
MRRIAVANQKGGVGKTTTVVNLAAALARLGFRTLVVDIDPQGNSTLSLGVTLCKPKPDAIRPAAGTGGSPPLPSSAEKSAIPETASLQDAPDAAAASPSNEQRAAPSADGDLPSRPYVPGTTASFSICDVLRDDCSVAQAIVARSERLDVLPSHIDLAALEGELLASAGRRMLLRDRLARIAGYDYVLLDCPPSLGLLNVNALAYATEVLVPLQCEFLALQGISLLIRTIELVRQRLNPALKIGGVLPCMFDGRRLLAKEVLAEIEKFFGKKVFRTCVRTTVKLAEAPSYGKTIFEYAPRSKGEEDYLGLGREVAGLPPQAASEAGQGARNLLASSPS